MERFSYKGGCGVCEHTRTRIKVFKRELAWAMDKWLQVISNKIVYTTKTLKNKAILNLKQHRMHCYVTLSNIF